MHSIFNFYNFAVSMWFLVTVIFILVGLPLWVVIFGLGMACLWQIAGSIVVDLKRE